MRSLPPLVLFLVSAVLVPPLVGCNHQAELDALRAYESDAASASAMCQGSADPTTDPNACGVTCEVCTTSVEHATPSCVSGVCRFRCEEDYRITTTNDACTYRPSCVGAATACAGDDCCASIAITPPNLTFRRSFDGAGSTQDGIDVVGWQDSSAPTVTLNGFEIDKYEVTVGRFRQFVEHYDAWRGPGGMNPRAGLGCHPAVPDTSCWRPGWSVATDYDGTGTVSIVPADAAELRRRIGSCGSDSNFTATAGAKETHPMNCVDFWEAFMFCMWDGGRLPTEAEWNFVAAGGALQRAYPWSDPPSSLTGLGTPTDAYARFGRADAEGTEPVSARASGASVLGARHMAGNVWEWVRDAVDPSTLGMYTVSGSNPIRLDGDLTVTTRHGLRGGSYKDPAARIRTAYRETRQPILRLNDTGFRCARGGS